MPTPREIAEKTSDKSKFESADAYCGNCGAPHGPGVNCGKLPDYSVDPTLPPDFGSLPGKNFKK